MWKIDNKLTLILLEHWIPTAPKTFSDDKNEFVTLDFIVELDYLSFSFMNISDCTKDMFIAINYNKAGFGNIRM